VFALNQKYHFTTLFCLGMHVISYAQVFNTIHTNKLQYGASIKLSVELNSNTKDFFYMKAAFNAGVGAKVFNYLFPTYNFEAQLYNGGLGSRAKTSVQPKRKLSTDIVNAFTLTVGSYKNTKQGDANWILENQIPLYYFSNLAQPSLQNPFQYSLSVGTNLIYSFRKQYRSQRVGFLNVHIGQFQTSYFNDGGAVMDKFLGDKEDRYYTGGVLFTYHLANQYFTNLIELGYHKFTGYAPNAFQISNALDVSFVNYKDTAEQFYNKGNWFVGAAHFKKGIAISLKAYNGFLQDLQRRIHYELFNAYHYNPYRKSYAVQVSYINKQNKISLQ
jgi:hypothetical protein